MDNDATDSDGGVALDETVPYNHNEEEVEECCWVPESGLALPPFYGPLLGEI